MDKNDFNNYANNYEQFHNQSIEKYGVTSSYYSEFKVKQVANFIDRTSKLKILDFGCGIGTTSHYFSEIFVNSFITGVDISEKSIEIANSKKIKNAFFEIFDGTKLNLPSNEFDLIFVSMVFHHVPESYHLDTLKELNRVLVKGGNLFVFEHNPRNFITRKIVKDCCFDADAVLLKANIFKKKIQTCFEKEITINYLLFLPRFKFLKYFYFVEKYLVKIPLGAQYMIRVKK